MRYSRVRQVDMQFEKRIGTYKNYICDKGYNYFLQEKVKLFRTEKHALFGYAIDDINAVIT